MNVTAELRTTCFGELPCGLIPSQQVSDGLAEEVRMGVRDLMDAEDMGELIEPNEANPSLGNWDARSMSVDRYRQSRQNQGSAAALTSHSQYL